MKNSENAPWICPVCGEKLNIYGKSFVCVNRHCYDIARSGYVNLLGASGKGNHGDDRLMVKARTGFLNKGYYAPLAEKLTDFVLQYTVNGEYNYADCIVRNSGNGKSSSRAAHSGLIIDAGCGEGYYTGRIAEAIETRRMENSLSEEPASDTCDEAAGTPAAVSASVVGLDISREAVAAAAKRTENVFLAVAGTSGMPLPDRCAAIVLNVFSPLFPEEFKRVLCPGGKLIRVVPGERHLWQLKELVYDRPYENPPPQIEVPGFEPVLTERVNYDITLQDNNSIRQLFMMTPYYYKTGENDQKKLLNAANLTTRVEFEIIVSECP